MKKHTDNKPAVATVNAHAAEPVSQAVLIQQIDLHLFKENPYNPRSEDSEESLLELAADIRMRGVMQAIRARKTSDGMYEVIFGHRRLRASILADMQTIPTVVTEATDEQSRVAAATENLQRKELTPFEESQLYAAGRDAGMSIEGMSEVFCKSKAHITSRLNLTRLIGEVATMLRRDEITLAVAGEFAHYNDQVQQEVYNKHFSEKCEVSWKGITAKDFRRKMFDNYMTKLDFYRFDKAGCLHCASNTHADLLFQDMGRSGCKDVVCLRKKNKEYLVALGEKMSQADPFLNLAYPRGYVYSEVVEELRSRGLQVEELDMARTVLNEQAELPDVPRSEDYAKSDEYEAARKQYKTDLAAGKKERAAEQKKVAEGRWRRYGLLTPVSVEVKYEVLQADRQDTASAVQMRQMPADGNAMVVATVSPTVKTDPTKELREKMKQNETEQASHIAAGINAMFKLDGKAFPKPALTKEEETMACYILLGNINQAYRTYLGFTKPLTDTRARLRFVKKMPEPSRASLFRFFILNFCQTMNFKRPEEDSAEFLFLRALGMLHYPKATKGLIDAERSQCRKQNRILQDRISAIELENTKPEQANEQQAPEKREVEDVVYEDVSEKQGADAATAPAIGAVPEPDLLEAHAEEPAAADVELPAVSTTDAESVPTDESVQEPETTEAPSVETEASADGQQPGGDAPEPEGNPSTAQADAQAAESADDRKPMGRSRAKRAA